jgi:TPP-dependent pyruvate/acetoin dehydrogenase alpha subunit
MCIYQSDWLTLRTSTTVHDIPSSDCCRHGFAKEKWFLFRGFEEKIEGLFPVNGALIRPSHLYLGQEAIAIGAITALKPNDLIIVEGVGQLVVW